jgi:hypothetical protein
VKPERPGERLPAASASPELHPSERELVRALRDIRYGSIEAVVHAGRIVHFERRERVRFADPTTGGSTSELQRHDRNAGGPLDPTKGTNDGTSQDDSVRGARRADDDLGLGGGDRRGGAGRTGRA